MFATRPQHQNNNKKQQQHNQKARNLSSNSEKIHKDGGNHKSSRYYCYNSYKTTPKTCSISPCNRTLFGVSETLQARKASVRTHSQTSSGCLRGSSRILRCYVHSLLNRPPAQPPDCPTIPPPNGEAITRSVGRLTYDTRFLRYLKAPDRRRQVSPMKSWAWIVRLL
jgi:hypothetical protein